MKNYFLKTSFLFILVSAFVFPASARAYPCEIHGACFDMSIVECHRNGGDISENVYYKQGLDADINAGCPKKASNENTSLITDKKRETDLAEYIKMIYVYGMSIVGIVATIVIMVGGFVWLSSLGNASRINDAKEWIGAALSGLALALFSYTILWIINPDLVNLQKLNPKPVTVQSTTGSGNNNSTPAFDTCMGVGAPCTPGVTKCCGECFKEVDSATNGICVATYKGGGCCEYPTVCANVSSRSECTNGGFFRMQKACKNDKCQ